MLTDVVSNALPLFLIHRPSSRVGPVLDLNNGPLTYCKAARQSDFAARMQGGKTLAALEAGGPRAEALLQARQTSLGFTVAPRPGPHRPAAPWGAPPAGAAGTSPLGPIPLSSSPFRQQNPAASNDDQTGNDTQQVADILLNLRTTG